MEYFAHPIVRLILIVFYHRPEFLDYAQPGHWGGDTTPALLVFILYYFVCIGFYIFELIFFVLFIILILLLNFFPVSDFFIKITT